MTTKISAALQTKPVAEFALHVPMAYVRYMAGRQRRFSLIVYPVMAALFYAFNFLVYHAWDKALASVITMVIGWGMLYYMNTPWISGPSKNWEWHYSGRGLSLRNTNNPIVFYGTNYVSPKRDTIISVVQTNWQEYPAQRVTWQQGSRKAKSVLLVYRPEDSALALDRLVPQLLAWPQNERQASYAPDH